jgi:hypothetical protein
MMASPSMTDDCTGNAATTCTARGKRWVRSLPLNVVINVACPAHFELQPLRVYFQGAC